MRAHTVHQQLELDVAHIVDVQHIVVVEHITWIEEVEHDAQHTLKESAI